MKIKRLSVFKYFVFLSAILLPSLLSASQTTKEIKSESKVETKQSDAPKCSVISNKIWANNSILGNSGNQITNPTKNILVSSSSNSFQDLATKKIIVPKVVAKPKPQPIKTQSANQGFASFYGLKPGWKIDPCAGKIGAAHKTLKFGTNVKVTNLYNGKSIDVCINDRGPYVDGRIIDLSNAGADLLQMRSRGVVPVVIEVINS